MKPIICLILKGLRTKYALDIHGERIGELETLSDALNVREVLDHYEFTPAEARALLQNAIKRN